MSDFAMADAVSVSTFWPTLGALSGQTKNVNWIAKETVYDFVQEASPVGLVNVIDHDLTPLLSNQNIGGYVFRPTGHSYSLARQVLIEAHSFMRGRFVRPSIVSDGEGGIDIEWNHNNRTVIVSCKAKRGQQGFIYYENDNDYNSKEFSLAYLKDRLDWLNRI